MKMKMLVIDEVLHQKLKNVSAKTGVKLQKLAERAVIELLKKEKEEKNEKNNRAEINE